jgi:hypothetical protein
VHEVKFEREITCFDPENSCLVEELETESITIFLRVILLPVFERTIVPFPWESLTNSTIWSSFVFQAKLVAFWSVAEKFEVWLISKETTTNAITTTIPIITKYSIVPCPLLIALIKLFKFINQSLKIIQNNLNQNPLFSNY